MSMPCQAEVLNWTHTLCTVLEENYKVTSSNHHKRAIERGESVPYHVEQLESIAKGEYNLRKSFTVETGRKYHKIVMTDNQQSVHAFVDKNTGEVYKPASWKSPHTKHVRYNLLDDKSRTNCYSRADWAGGYLYLR
tara:strand:+ start:8786 stop:9193 length:408 start_codon:yes stop_codon:yes gene_type:complete